jgi:hypothetical protein
MLNYFEYDTNIPHDPENLNSKRTKDPVLLSGKTDYLSNVIDA